jgi:hypothetical protein
MIKRLLLIFSLLMAAFAGKGIYAEQETKPTHGIGLLETGSFHGEEVSAHTGEEWLGLYISGNHSMLVKSRLQVETVHDDIGDAPDEQTGKTVSVDLPFEPVFLVKRARMLREGPVFTVFAEKPDYAKTLEKVSPLKLEMATTSYELKVISSQDGEQCSEHEFPRNAQLVLTNGNSKQVLYSLEDCGNDPSWYLLWAGDIDLDGKLDLYVSVSYHYNVSQRKLFLSSQATKGQLVKEVAGFETYGC